MESNSWQKRAQGPHIETEAFEAQRKKDIEEVAGKYKKSVENLNTFNSEVVEWQAGPAGKQWLMKKETITGEIDETKFTMSTKWEDGRVVEPLKVSFGNRDFFDEEANKMRKHILDAIKERDQVNVFAKDATIQEITMEDDHQDRLLTRFFDPGSLGL